jgi:hypothetical protein
MRTEHHTDHVSRSTDVPAPRTAGRRTVNPRQRKR